MSISVLRQPSDTPNILVEDDCRMFYYGLNGRNGVLAGYKEECDFMFSNNTFTVGSGELVFFGYQVQINDEGESIVLDDVFGERYYVMFLELDTRISSNLKASIKSSYSQSGYPEVDIGDDLFKNSQGIARLPLYSFYYSLNFGITQVKKLFNYLILGNARLINGIDIKKDENGVLRVGNVIIPQKKVLWENTSWSSGQLINPSEQIFEGERVELVFSNGLILPIQSSASIYTYLYSLEVTYSSLDVENIITGINKKEITCSFDFSLNTIKVSSAVSSVKLIKIYKVIE